MSSSLQWFKMSTSTKKRTLDSFFKPIAKRARVLGTEAGEQANNSSSSAGDELEFSHHATYPFPIPEFSAAVSSELSSFPATAGTEIKDQVDLDLLYFKPYIHKSLQRKVFQFLRSELPFYRIEYKIRRGGVEAQINTPRYTTVFGIDETSRFGDSGEIVDVKTGKKVINDKHYSKYPPRPIPKCLDDLRLSTEAVTGCKFNFCLVNYYASGSDSISYHSDDERFLGALPAIASFSLGGTRDFLMKHKPAPPNQDGPRPPVTKPIKLALASGDMILMKGPTQANWLHSVPKRTGKNADDGGRINITFRRAMVKGGTENYYNYNVGNGPAFRWDDGSKEMRLCGRLSASNIIQRPNLI